jgi:hypothetical protein
MKNHFYKLALVSGILLLFVPVVVADAPFTTGFEECEQFGVPSTDCTLPGITYSTTGTATAAYVTTSEANTGTKSHRLSATPGASSFASFNLDGGGGPDFDCDGVDTTMRQWDAWLNVGILPTGTGSIWFGVHNSNSLNFDLSAATSANYYAFRIDSSGNLYGYSKSGTSVIQNTAVLTVLSVDTWYHFQFVCSPTTAIWRELTTEAQGVMAVNSLAAIPFWRGLISGGASGTTATKIFTDDISYGIPAQPMVGHRFCANPDTPDFDYTYAAGWEAFEDFGFDTDDGFVAETSTSETAYLGKGFTTGSKAFSTIARIEAGEDADDSLFAIAYTTGAGGLPSASTDGTGLELAGLDGGNFDNSIQVIFWESGNDWNIKIVQNVAGTLTTIGSAVQHGNPNGPTTYNFTVNSQGASIDSTNGEVAGYTASLRDANGALIMPARNLPLGLQDVVWMDQWFAASADDVILSDALTVLDDPDRDEGDSLGEDSTCIYDLLGDSVLDGPGGLEPPGSTPDQVDEDPSTCTSFLCVDSTNVPEGFTTSTFNLFLGVLLMLAIGVGVFIWTKSTTMGLGGLTAGFLISFAFGLIPLWVIVALVIISVAIIFVRVKGAAGGG